MQQIILGADDVSVTIKIVDSTDFSPETGVTSASAGLALWYRKGATGAVTALTEIDLAAVDSAHSDGGIKHLSDGLYRVDLPDAAIPTIENEVTVVGGTVTGMHVLSAALIGVQPIGAPAGVSIAADLAAIEAQTDDIGAAGAGLTAIPWNAAWDAEVQSEAADALTVYAPATASALATAQADLTTLLSRVTGVVALATSTAATAIRAALGMAAADLDDQLDAVLVAAAGGSTLGGGSEAVRIYVDDDGGNPVDGAAVWITTDEAGSNVVAGTVHTLGTGYTPVLMLDPGTYYVWKQANSINFTNPSAITVVDA